MATETANNTTGLLRPNIPKLQGHANYMGWRRDLRTYLRQQKLWNHCVEDPPADPLFAYREPDLADIQALYPAETRARQNALLKEAINLYKIRQA